MNKMLIFAIKLLVLVSVPLSGYGGEQPTPRNDLLTKIMARGTLVLAIDSNYPPQSELKPGATRSANTKCAPTEYTANEVKGFDIDTAVEIARDLDVEPCFVTPPWTQVTAGNWSDRWDLNINSMTITQERMKVLYFTQPYYATPAAVFVHKNNKTFSQPSDLSGKRVGACTGCTYDYYLQGTLVLPGSKVDFVIKDPVIIGYDVDIPALEDLSLGDGVELDAALVAQPAAKKAIENGMPLKQLGKPVFFEYMATAIDKKSRQNPIAFVLKVNEIIQKMHNDGTLLKISKKYYGQDFTTAASQFDLRALDQLP